MRQTRQRVCIQGLGYVGSAVAVAVAAAKDQSGNPLYDVVGVDLPTESGQGRVDAINRGKFPFSTSDRQLIKILSEVQSAGNLSATIDESVYEEADFVIVDIQMDVSTDVNDLQVGKGLFLDAIQAIGRRIRDSALVIIETTVAPGTCDKLVLPALQEEFLKRGLAKDSVLLAHSFERVMPGKEYLNSIINICRVYSGHSVEAGDICEKFLSSLY